MNIIFWAIATMTVISVSVATIEMLVEKYRAGKTVLDVYNVDVVETSWAYPKAAEDEHIIDVMLSPGGNTWEAPSVVPSAAPTSHARRMSRGNKPLFSFYA